MMPSDGFEKPPLEVGEYVINCILTPLSGGFDTYIKNNKNRDAVLVSRFLLISTKTSILEINPGRMTNMKGDRLWVGQNIEQLISTQTEL